MATIQSFNGLLRNFIQELCQTFPEDATLAMCLEGFDTLVKANARKPMDLFMQSVGPHAQFIMSKDPALFEKPLTLSGTLDLKTYWDSPGLSQASKDAIWQYLQTLYMLASTVSAVPPEMLSAIESLAQNCATKIQSGEADLTSVTNMLLHGGESGLSSLLGTLGLGADADMNALLTAPSDQSTSSSSRRSSSSKKKPKK